MYWKTIDTDFIYKNKTKCNLNAYLDVKVVMFKGNGSENQGHACEGQPVENVHPYKANPQVPILMPFWLCICFVKTLKFQSGVKLSSTFSTAECLQATFMCFPEILSLLVSLPTVTE